MQRQILSTKPIFFHLALTVRQVIYEIIKLARPFMETLRLIVYNWKLREANIISHQINIKSNPITIELCTQCAKFELVNIAPFWIGDYRMPQFGDNQHPHRACAESEQHFLIECLVEHEPNPKPAGISNERWESSLDNFLSTCDQLAHYLHQHGVPVDEDPFARVLNRFIDEEQTIVRARHLETSMNQRVLRTLIELREIRQDHLHQLAASNEQLSLDDAKRLIQKLSQLDTVKRLIDSVDKTRQLNMNAYELRINTDQIRNRAVTQPFEIPV